VSEIASHDVNNERQVQSLPSFTSVVTVLHGGMEPPASETNLLLPIAYWSAPALNTSILVKYRDESPATATQPPI